MKKIVSIVSVLPIHSATLFLASALLAQAAAKYEVPMRTLANTPDNYVENGPYMELLGLAPFPGDAVAASLGLTVAPPPENGNDIINSMAEPQMPFCGYITMQGHWLPGNNPNIGDQVVNDSGNLAGSHDVVNLLADIENYIDTILNSHTGSSVIGSMDFECTYPACPALGISAGSSQFGPITLNQGDCEGDYWVHFPHMQDMSHLSFWTQQVVWTYEMVNGW